MSDKDPIIKATRLIVSCAEAYMDAVHGLARMKDGKTLFEHSPSKDQDCFDAWVNLNNTGRRLRECLDTLKQGLPSEAEGPKT